jgi:uncharacterized protein (TIGR02677 family)
MDVSWPGLISPELWGFASEPDARARVRQAAVLAALLEAGIRMPMVGLDQLRGLVDEIGWWDSPSNEDLRSVLEHLHRERLVVPFRDWDQTSSTYHDARRRKESWTLTHKGRGVVEAVKTTTENLERPLQMPPGLLKSLGQAIERVLHAAAESSGQEAPANRFEAAHRLEAGLSAIDGFVEQLRRAAHDFYEALASLNQEDVTQDDIFRISLQRIVMVLEEFVQQTDSSLGSTRHAATRLAEIGHQQVAQQAVDAAGLFDPGAAPVWVANRVAKLGRLDGWLEPGGAIDSMIGNAIEAIETLIRAIERRFHAHDRGSDLASDFHRLAMMLHAQDDQEQAQQVFAAACGLWPARHPRRPRIEEVPEDSGGAAGYAQVSASTVLRRIDSGVRTRSARKRVPDTTAAKAARRAAEAEELSWLQRVCQELVTAQPVGLEHFDGLDSESAVVLIELIEQAMDAFDPGEGCGRAANALCELTFWPVIPARIVTLHFGDEGALTRHDLLVHITSDYAANDGFAEAAA